MNVGHAVFQPRAMHGIFYYPLSVKLQHERDFSGHLKHACMSINVSEIVFFFNNKCERDLGEGHAVSLLRDRIFMHQYFI